MVFVFVLMVILVLVKFGLVFSYLQEEVIFNEMFCEVEELMEDMQYKLCSVVEEMEVEEVVVKVLLEVNLVNLFFSYYNEINIDMKVGNNIIYVY